MTINQEGAKRAEEQAAIAGKLGLALPRPFFALGTELIKYGQDRAMQKRKEFEAYPLAIEAFEQCQQIVKDERRKDITCTLGDLVMHPDGKIQRRSRPNGGIVLSEHALGQLCNRVPEAPTVAGSYLAAIPPDRRAAEFNAWVAATAAKDKEVVARLWKPAGHDQHSAYAFVSTRYVPYDPDQLMGDLIRAFERDPVLKDARADLRYNGERGRIRIMGHSNAGRDLTVGEVFRAGVDVGWGDDGSRGLNGMAFALRALCINLTYAGAKAQLFRLRHTGNVEELRAAMRGAMDQSAGVVKQWIEHWQAGKKVKIDVPQAIDALSLLARVQEATAKGERRPALADALIRVPGESPVYVSEQVNRAWQREPDQNVTGLANAMTRAAHESAWRNVDAAEAALQDQAVALVEMSPERLIATIAEETNRPSLSSIVEQGKRGPYSLDEIARGSN